MSKEAQNKVQRLELEFSQVVRTESILSSKQAEKLFVATPKRWKYDRPAKGRGTWTYVKVSYVRRQLDSIFGFNWDFEVETSLKEAFDVAMVTGVCVVKGTLVCRTSTSAIRKTQFGRAEVKFTKEAKELPDGTSRRMPLDFGNDMKAAASDALKKCASLLGIAADIYETDEFFEIQIKENNDLEAGVNARIKAAQDQLEQEGTQVK